jgi:hypothetical protein
MFRPSDGLLDAVSESVRAPCSVVRPLSGGWNDGATLISVAGDEAVLKVFGNRTRRQVSAIENGVKRAVENGWPSPSWHAVGEFEERTWCIQQFARGAPCSTLTVDAATEIVKANTRQAAVLVPAEDRQFLIDFSTLPRKLLHEDAFGNVARVRAFSKRATLLVDQVLSRASSNDLPDTDLVHGDYNPPNILFHDGRVSAFVDLNELGYGTRAFDLVDLYRQSLSDPNSADGREVLRQAAVDIVGEAGFFACLGTKIVGSLVWFIERMPERVDVQVEQMISHLATL